MNHVSGSANSAAASPGAVRRASSYFSGQLPRWQRLLVGLVGVALIPVMFFPILPLWRILLVAPQYREGLVMKIYANDVVGDIDRINILNHYIGMQKIDSATFPEFGYIPWVLTAFGIVALLAAVVGRRWLALLGWLGFAVFGTLMMLHFRGWLVEFGTNLDPKAALDFGEFTPPLIGTAVRGNFTVQSLPFIGGYILFLAGGLAPLMALADLLKWKRSSTPGGKAVTAPVTALALVTLLSAVATSAVADEFKSYAEPPPVSPLQVVVNDASPGDTVRVPAGTHAGQLILEQPVVLVGTPESILDGTGKSTVLIVRAPGTVLRGFKVQNSGYELLFDDSGILIDEADDVLMEDLVLENTNHGIYIRNALRPVIRNCRIEGRRGRAHQENHGNAIHIWHSRDALVEGNRILHHRDGIYLSFAETAIIRENVVHDQDRFGLHSMYSQKNVIERNTYTRNAAGVALMFSNRMEMKGNLFIHNRGHRTYGILLKDCSDSEFRHNRLVNNTIALFLDGSNRNVFEENLFAENGWGVIAYSSSESNVFTRNSFLSNDYQVSLDMRRTRNQLHREGVGNYWSDARPFDLDGDGIGDAPFNPVSLFAFVSKQHPDLTVFSGSPAVLALDLAQRSLPALQLTEFVDPAPLLNPVPIPAFQGPPVPPLPGSRSGSSVPLALTAMAATAGGLVTFRRRS